MLRRIREFVMEKALRRLFRLPTPDSILQPLHNSLKKGHEQVGKPVIRRYQSEIAALRQFDVWIDLRRSLKAQACEMLWTKSKTVEDIIAAKMLLYALDMEEQVLAGIEKIKLV